MGIALASQKISNYMLSVSVPYIGDKNVAVMRSLADKLNYASSSGNTGLIYGVFRRISRVIPHIVKGGFVSKAYVEAVEASMQCFRDAARYVSVIDTIVSRYGVSKIQKVISLLDRLASFDCGWLCGMSRRLKRISREIRQTAKSYLPRVHGVGTDIDAVDSISGMSGHLKPVIENAINLLKRSITSDRIVGKLIKKRMLRVVAMIRKVKERYNG